MSKKKRKKNKAKSNQKKRSGYQQSSVKQKAKKEPVVLAVREMVTETEKDENDKVFIEAGTDSVEENTAETASVEEIVDETTDVEAQNVEEDEDREPEEAEAEDSGEDSEVTEEEPEVEEEEPEVIEEEPEVTEEEPEVIEEEPEVTEEEPEVIEEEPEITEEEPEVTEEEPESTEEEKSEENTDAEEAEAEFFDSYDYDFADYDAADDYNLVDYETSDYETSDYETNDNEINEFETNDNEINEFEINEFETTGDETENLEPNDQEVNVKKASHLKTKPQSESLAKIKAEIKSKLGELRVKIPEFEKKVQKKVGKTVKRTAKRTVSLFRYKSRKARPDNFAQYFFVIRELTTREIKRKYARSSLGIIWSVLNPLMTMIVMSLVFSTMFRRSIENFPIYLLTGQIFWSLFDTATTSSMSSLVDNKSLLVKAKLPKQTFILSRIYTALVNFGYTCIAYILMVLVFRIRPSAAMLLFPVDVLFVLAFSTGIGYMLSVAYVFWADIKYFYGIFLRLLMYLSALFYPVSNLSETMQKVVEMNPVYLMIAFARSCVMYGKVPERYVWIRLIIWCGISLGGGLFVFKFKENDVMQRI